MRHTRFTLLLLLSSLNVYSINIDQLQGEWVSNKFGYLKVEGNVLTYEVLWYKKDTTKQFCSYTSIPMRGGKMQFKGDTIFIPGYPTPLKLLVIKIKNDSLFLKDLFDNYDVKEPLIYTRLSGSKGITTKFDSIVMPLPAPYIVSSYSPLWKDGEVKLKIYNDTIYFFKGNKQVCYPILFKRGDKEALDTLLAHLPVDFPIWSSGYANASYSHTLYMPHSAIIYMGKKILHLELDGENLSQTPELAYRIYTLITTPYLDRLKYFNKAKIYSEKNVYQDFTGMIPGKYIVRYAHDFIVKGNPELIKETREVKLYALKIDTVLYPKPSSFDSTCNYIFFRKNKTGDTTDMVADSNHVLCMNIFNTPYLNQSKYKIYYQLRTSIGVEPRNLYANLYENVKYTGGDIGPLDLMQMARRPNHDEYLKCIDHYLKKHCHSRSK